MTLYELKEYVKAICLAHEDIKDFYIGSSYNEAQDINLTYPLVFYELPYFIGYNLSPRSQVDVVQFAFNVFVESNSDKIQEDHDAISRAKEIGDEIVTYILTNQSYFVVSSITAISVREFGDDSVAGMRFEWTVQLPRTTCDSDFTMFDL